jgi:hypothetical protein
MYCTTRLFDVYFWLSFTCCCKCSSSCTGVLGPILGFTCSHWLTEVTAFNNGFTRSYWFTGVTWLWVINIFLLPMCSVHWFHSSTRGFTSIFFLPICSLYYSLYYLTAVELLKSWGSTTAIGYTDSSTFHQQPDCLLIVDTLSQLTTVHRHVGCVLVMS